MTFDRGEGDSPKKEKVINEILEICKGLEPESLETFIHFLQRAAAHPKTLCIPELVRREPH